ncbi:hypothetical protein JA1_002740 [Spathaspora sp. JA1]|nr:hypothetical protein JA1_002740 [Spathaspora sp. JA1]
MSVTTNRVALAPIKDTHLNSSSSSNSSTPLKDKKKRPSILFNINKHPFSVSEIKRRRQDLFMKSLTIPNSSATSLNKKYSPLRSLSFSDSRSTSSTSSSPTVKVRTHNKTITNDTAGLAATKLKLKLQLALYKIQQQKQQQQPQNSKSLTRVSNRVQVDETTTIKFTSATSLKLLSPPSSAKTSSFSSPSRQNVSLASSAKAMSSLPTPPQAPTNYISSVNINLETKAKLLASVQSYKDSSSTRVTLSNIAQRKQSNKKSQKLRLFQIKKNSIFYSDESEIKKLPLIQGETFMKPKPLHISSSLDILQHMPSTTSPTKQQVVSGLNVGSFILPYAAAAASAAATGITTTDPANPSILLNPPSNINQSFNSSHATNLPSINKILRTPIKRANSLQQQQNHHHQQQHQATRASRLPTVTDDTTIDEDNDMTIINNTTIYNNSTIEHNDTTIPEKNEDDEEDEEEEDDSFGRKKDILSSSPLRNPFGTPNSFSVARSLLQLGGHRM